MYRSETRALRTAEQNLLERTKRGILRWTMGIKRIEKIRKEEIRARADVANRDENVEMDDGNKED